MRFLEKMTHSVSITKYAPALICAAILTSGCSSDSGDKGDNGGSNTPTNTANEATFKQSGGSLLEMVQHSKSASVTNRSKRKSNFVGFDRIESFAFEGSSGSNNAPKDSSGRVSSGDDSSVCPDLMIGDFPEFEDSSASQGDGFNITKGQSCSDALDGMKVQYNKIIDGLEGQVNALVNFDAAKFSRCNGMKAEKASIDKNQAAVAWRITPDKSTGMNGSILIFGGAAGPLVTIGSEFEGKFSMPDFSGGSQGPQVPDFDDDVMVSDGDLPRNPPPISRDQPGAGNIAMEYRGKNTTTGDIVAKTLSSSLNSAFIMKMDGGGQPGGKPVGMSLAFDSKSIISGLAEGDRLKIEETVDFDLGTSGDGKSKAVSATFNLKVEEIDGQKLKISGSADMGSGSKEVFELTMAKDRSGNCQVTEVKESKAN